MDAKTEEIEDTDYLARISQKVGLRLRDFQSDGLESILAGKDTLVIANTGSGKSLIYLGATLVNLEKNKNAITVLVEPLISVAIDQQMECEKLKLSCIRYTQDTTVPELAKIKRGGYSVLIVSPEVLVGKFGDLFNSKSYKENMSLICIDECHVCHDWGQRFRTDLCKMFMSWTQAAGQRRPPLLMITATLPPKDRKKLFVALGLNHGEVQIIEYYKFSSEEIFIEMEDSRPGPRSQDEFFYLEDVIEDLHKAGACAEKCIIVCSTVTVLDRVVAYMQKRFPVVGKIGQGVWPEGMLWARFDGVSTSEPARRGIINEFKKPLGTLRCVLGTTSVIMGINMKTVSKCKYIGIPYRMWYIFQLLGRAGRDGCKVVFSLCWNNSDKPNLEHGSDMVSLDINEGIEEVIAFYENKTSCLRTLLHTSMGYPEHIEGNGSCCTNCVDRKQSDNSRSSTSGTNGTNLNFGYLHSHSFHIPSTRRRVVEMLADIKLKNIDAYFTEGTSATNTNVQLADSEYQQVMENLKKYKFKSET